MGWDLVALILLSIGIVYVASLVFGALRWNGKTQALRTRLDAARPPVGKRTVDFGDLDGLPAPVQRYFRTVLTDGQPVVTRAHVQHEGTFNMSETGEQWKPFTSEQWVTTHRPGFVWNGRVAVLPGVPARVHDAYVAGEGILNVALLGLVSVADFRGKGELADGELMRYLAEASWYPTALLPGQGTTWEAVDERSAIATLTDGYTDITMQFAFDDQGLIETVRAEARGRTVGDEIVPTPWQGRFWNYEQRDGMLVPIDAEVAWLLPEGEKAYWRGHITHLDYDHASAGETD